MRTSNLVSYVQIIRRLQLIWRERRKERKMAGKEEGKAPGSRLEWGGGCREGAFIGRLVSLREDGWWERREEFGI